jgi:hypothetical protein
MEVEENETTIGAKVLEDALLEERRLADAGLSQDRHVLRSFSLWDPDKAFTDLAVLDFPSQNQI